jgi:hypothetical protein
MRHSLMGPLLPPKKSRRSRQNRSLAGYEVHAGGRRMRSTCRSATCVHADSRIPRRGKYALYGECAAQRARTSTFSPAACDRRSRLRFRPAAHEVETVRRRTYRTLSHQCRKPSLRRYAQTAALSKALENRTHQCMLQNFRRIQVRYGRILNVFQGLLDYACLLITLRHLCN